MTRAPSGLPLLAGAAGLAAGGALAGTAYGFAAYVVHHLTRPARAPAPTREFTPFETGVDYEDVVVHAEDGTDLPGWLFLRAQEDPLVLACGGYRGRRSDLLGISSSLWRSGFNVLLFDYRGHGGAPGSVTLGYRELADARAALRFARDRFPDALLGVVGFSMGASVAIMLAAREPDVRAVWADSPFTSQREIVRLHMARRFRQRPSRHAAPLARAVLALVERRLERQFGYRFADVEPVRDVVRLGDRPLFLVHGEADRTVPVEHGRQVLASARAAGVPVESWFLPGVGHCGAYFADRPAYCSRAATFFRRHLAGTRR